MKFKNKTLCSQLDDIFRLDKKIAIKEFGENFYSYFEILFKNKSGDSYYRLAKHIFDVADASGKIVLDAGSGYGLISILLATFGAKKVVGMDSKTEHIKVSKKILKKIRPLPKNIYIQKEDVLHTRYPHGYFDMIIANEVISHVRDLKKFLIETRRILKKDGILYICDCNNSLDLIGKLKRKKIWHMTEFGDKNEKIDKDIVKGHKEPFTKIRKRIIKKILKKANEKEINLLAKQTKGFWGEQLESLINEYKKNKKIPVPMKGCCHPITGEAQEAEFNPFKLKKLLSQTGFKSQLIKPRFYGQNISKKIAAGIIRTFYPFTQPISPKFEIKARKT